MQISFKGKRVVVAGGSRGIGRSIALGFASAGASVSICARGQAGLDATAGEIRALGAKVHALPCDLADKEAIAAYVAAARLARGIDILVNNASGFGGGDTEEGWSKGLDIDVMATVRASNAAIPHIERSGGGAIVNISSISGLGASARTASYAAVKAAVINYTMSQGLMLAPKKIRVNAMRVRSNFPADCGRPTRRRIRQLYNAVFKSIPWGRMGKPEEVANAALFLCSDQASWITGQTLTVDGGQSLG